jgi:AraC-like DNA-binding protein
MYYPISHYDSTHWLNRISPSLWAVNNERNLAGWTEHRKRPRFHRLVFARTGKLVFESGGGVHTCGQNHFVLIPAGMENTCRVAGPQAVWRYYVDFDWNFFAPFDLKQAHVSSNDPGFDRLDARLIQPEIVPRGVLKGPVAEPDFTFDQLDRMCLRWCGENPVEQLSCRGAFLEMLVLLLTPQFPVESRLQEHPEAVSEDRLVGKVRYLLDNFARCPIDRRPSIEMALGGLGRSYGYLSRIFKDATGMSPLNFVNSRRMDYAVELLRDTELTFAEVGYRVGINNPSYFSRMFKKHTGKSPGEFHDMRGKMCAQQTAKNTPLRGNPSPIDRAAPADRKTPSTKKTSHSL